MVFQKYLQVIDELVHPSVLQTPLRLEFHRLYMTGRILNALLALAIFPFYALFIAAPGLVEYTFFCFMLMPVLSVIYLSRTADFEMAHFISFLTSVPFVFALSLMMGSYFTATLFIWMALGPFEAVLARRFKAVINACIITVSTLLLTMSFNAFPSQPRVDLDINTLHYIGLASFVLGFINAITMSLVMGYVMRLRDILVRYNEENYQLLAGNMTDAIIRHQENGHVTFVSTVIEAMSGAPSSLMMKEGLKKRIHEDDVKLYETTLQRALHEDEPQSVQFRLFKMRPLHQLNLETRMMWLEGALKSGNHEYGDFIWVEMRAQKIHGYGHNRKKELVSVLRDVTERRAQEDKIQKAQQETARMQAVKSRFLANITHELRTPLNAVNGFSQMLINEDLMNIDKPKRLEYATLIHEAGEHLLSVVNSILDMSKLESGKFDFIPEEFFMGDLLETCTQIVKIKADEGQISLKLVLPPNLPEIEADKRACRQIFLNLLSNAVKFTQKGGSVTSHVRVERNKMFISVADTGIGIAEEDLPHIGEAFFQAKGNYDRLYEGTGLGLSVVKGLVALHKGEMKISSKLGQGTVVTIVLPIKQSEVHPFEAKSIETQKQPQVLVNNTPTHIQKTA